jgi:hypothetical protein
MQIAEMLAAAGGMQSIARELGVSEAQARTGAEALLPAILGGFKKQAPARPAGLGGLLDMVGGLGGGGLFDEVLAPAPTNVSHGNDVLEDTLAANAVLLPLFHEQACRIARPEVEGLSVGFGFPTIVLEDLSIRSSRAT